MLLMQVPPHLSRASGTMCDHCTASTCTPCTAAPYRHSALTGVRLQVCHLKVHGGPAPGVVVLSDEKHTVSCSADATVRITDILAGAVRVTLRGKSGPITGVAVAADQVRLVRSISHEPVSYAGFGL